MKIYIALIFFFYSSLSISQITYSDFTKDYDKAFNLVIEEQTANLKGQYKTIFTNEFRKIFLSEISKKYFYNAYDNKLIKSYLEAENFGGTYAALLRMEGAKKLNPTLQRQQTIYSRNALNYANTNQCSAIIQNKPINKANGGISGIELYAKLPINDYKNYFEAYTKSAYLIFNGKDESVSINDNELDTLNKLFISNLKQRLTENKLNLFISVIEKGFANSSDENVCEVGKILLDTLLTTGNEQQSKLVINAWIKGRLLKK
jgi:hypothetical protein